jgi:hypothetical protein
MRRGRRHVLFVKYGGSRHKIALTGTSWTLISPGAF